MSNTPIHQQVLLNMLDQLSSENTRLKLANQSLDMRVDELERAAQAAALPENVVPIYDGISPEEVPSAE